MHHKSQTWQTTLSWCQRCPSSKMTHVLPRILNSTTYYHTTPTTTATTQFKQFSYSLWVQFQLGPSRALCLMTRSSARSATLTLIRLKTFSDTFSYSFSDLKDLQSMLRHFVIVLKIKIRQAVFVNIRICFSLSFRQDTCPITLPNCRPSQTLHVEKH